MEKTAVAIKIDGDLIKRFRAFCKERGVKYSFFIEEAIKEKLEEEKLKDDILDLKMLHREEKSSVPFEEYLRKRNV
jgi:predicted transcriptional regulator